MLWELSIKNEVDELQRVALLVDTIGHELGLTDGQRMDIGLVLEEMVANVIFYAYPDHTDASIDIRAESNEHRLTFVVSDEGREFDPTEKAPADMDTNPAERPLGGMGIFIVRNIMDNVSYQRSGGRNYLTMTYTTQQ